MEAIQMKSSEDQKRGQFPARSAGCKLKNQRNLFELSFYQGNGTFVRARA